MDLVKLPPMSINNDKKIGVSLILEIWTQFKTVSDSGTTNF